MGVQSDLNVQIYCSPVHLVLRDVRAKLKVTDLRIIKVLKLEELLVLISFSLKCIIILSLIMKLIMD